MTDLSLTIAPKSDQLNADDLIPGPMTITISRVSACPNSAEQPIAMSFDGDGGKPYKPCKSMRRVLVQIWGKDGNGYTGRSMTIYRDPKVQFGGLEVGGIRISHMSHIDKPVTMALTATRANRKPYTVKPLTLEKRQQTAAEWLASLERDLEGCTCRDEADERIARDDVKRALSQGSEKLKGHVNDLVAETLKRFEAPMDEDPFPGDLPSQEDAA